MEVGLDGVKPWPGRAGLAERDVQLEGLALVAKIERAKQLLLRGLEVLELQLVSRRALHLGEQLAGDGQALAERPHARPDVIVLDLRGQQAEGGEVAGMPWHEHTRDPDLLSQRQGMHRPGTAEGDQREVARIVAALDRDLANRRGHARDGDPHDAFGQRLDRQPAPEPRAEVAEGSVRSLTIDRDAAAESPGGSDPT